jgi:hypothetical protein
MSMLSKLLPFLSAVVKAWNSTIAFLTARQAEQAGRNAAIIQQKEAGNEAVDMGLEARRAARARDAAPGGLRADDGYRRD